MIAQPYKACSPLINDYNLKGKIALIERGDCMFVEKCRRAQNAGAIGVIIVGKHDHEVISDRYLETLLSILDNKKDSDFMTSPVFAMSGDGSSDVTIPAVFIFGRDGTRLRERMRRIPAMTVRLGEKVLNPSKLSCLFLREISALGASF